MHIMTKDGWKQLSPREFALPGHTPTLLERMGITPQYDPHKAMVDYCNGKGIGVYFTYHHNGNHIQTLGAKNPLRGMWAETREG